MIPIECKNNYKWYHTIGRKTVHLIYFIYDNEMKKSVCGQTNKYALRQLIKNDNFKKCELCLKRWENDMQWLGLD
jgi:hypothetical protein